MSEKVILIAEPKGAQPQTLTPEIRESVKSLFFHPGFKFLLNRLALQREYMKHELEAGTTYPLETLRLLQTGIYWADWLEHQAQTIAKHQPNKVQAREARKPEMEMFERIKQNIVVGEGTESATKSE